MSDIRITDQTRVNAPSDAVWLAIVDPAAHARWHPFVTEITGEHELDQIRACAVLVGGKPGESVFRPKNVIVRAMVPMIRRRFHGAQRAILAGLKDALESTAVGQRG